MDRIREPRGFTIMLTEEECDRLERLLIPERLRRAGCLHPQKQRWQSKGMWQCLACGLWFTGQKDATEPPPSAAPSPSEPEA